MKCRYGSRYTIIVSVWVCERVRVKRTKVKIYLYIFVFICRLIIIFEKVAGERGKNFQKKYHIEIIRDRRIGKEN